MAGNGGGAAALSANEKSGRFLFHVAAPQLLLSVLEFANGIEFYAPHARLKSWSFGVASRKLRPDIFIIEIALSDVVWDREFCQCFQWLPSTRSALLPSDALQQRNAACFSLELPRGLQSRCRVKTRYMYFSPNP